MLLAHENKLFKVKMHRVSSFHKFPTACNNVLSEKKLWNFTEMLRRMGLRAYPNIWPNELRRPPSDSIESFGLEDLTDSLSSVSTKALGGEGEVRKESWERLRREGRKVRDGRKSGIDKNVSPIWGNRMMVNFTNLAKACGPALA
jgi:hypothetical protein